jgi:hypothetical protein
MNVDLKNSLTFTTLGAPLSRATNNVATAGFDLQQYTGEVAVRVALGVKTAGDNDGAVTVTLQSAANNTASEATTVTAFGNVATTNNTAASGTLLVDPRSCSRYLFARIVLAGTNSPAYPVAIEAIGHKQVQP